MGSTQCDSLNIIHHNGQMLPSGSRKAFWVSPSGSADRTTVVLASPERSSTCSASSFDSTGRTKRSGELSWTTRGRGKHPWSISSPMKRVHENLPHVCTAWARVPYEVARTGDAKSDAGENGSHILPSCDCCWVSVWGARSGTTSFLPIMLTVQP